MQSRKQNVDAVGRSCGSESEFEARGKFPGNAALRAAVQLAALRIDAPVGTWAMLHGIAQHGGIGAAYRGVWASIAAKSMAEGLQSVLRERIKGVLRVSAWDSKFKTQ